MALSTAMTEITGYIEALAVTPPFRRVKQLALEQEPYQATSTMRHFELHDDGLDEVLFIGVATLPRVELRRLQIRIKYVYQGDYDDLEGYVSDDRERIIALLNDPATYAASTSIQAIPLDIPSSVERDKEFGYFILTLNPKVHVAIY